MPPIVLVHGCPETAAVWDPLCRRLTELGHPEPVRLSPPGFGAPVPDGFEPTLAGYREWLPEALRELGEPVDLVGHDWGGGLAVAVAIDHPELLRSWVSDAVGVFDPDYAWHELARIWQTPAAGETWVQARLGRRDAEGARLFTAGGLEDEAVARELAAGFDAAMGRCILSLYRSAEQPVLAELGRDIERARARPGLHLLAEADDFVGSETQRTRCAERAGARVTRLPGLGHWWMAQGEGRAGADALTAFWASLAG